MPVCTIEHAGKHMLSVWDKEEPKVKAAAVCFTEKHWRCTVQCMRYYELLSSRRLGLLVLMKHCTVLKCRVNAVHTAVALKWLFRSSKGTFFNGEALVIHCAVYEVLSCYEQATTYQVPMIHTVQCGGAELKACTLVKHCRVYEVLRVAMGRQFITKVLMTTHCLRCESVRVLSCLERMKAVEL